MEDLTERVLKLELQMQRVVADQESEKGTRARVNSDHEERLRTIERKIYSSAGALAVLQVLIGIMLALLKK